MKLGDPTGPLLPSLSSTLLFVPPHPSAGDPDARAGAGPEVPRWADADGGGEAKVRALQRFNGRRAWAVLPCSRRAYVRARLCDAEGNAPPGGEDSAGCSELTTHAGDQARFAKLSSATAPTTSCVSRSHGRVRGKPASDDFALLGLSRPHRAFLCRPTKQCPSISRG